MSDNKATIRIAEDGSARAIYSDETMPLVRQLGPFTVRRASTVEWEGGEAGGWAVRSERDTGLAIRIEAGALKVSRDGQIALFPTRAEALQREVEMFWELA